MEHTPIKRHVNQGGLDCDGWDMCAWCGACLSCHRVLETEHAKLPANNEVYGPGCIDCHYWLLGIDHVPTHVHREYGRTHVKKYGTLAWTGEGPPPDPDSLIA